MSYQLILPFFPEELRELLTRPIDLGSDDQRRLRSLRRSQRRDGAYRLQAPYTVERLQAAIERVARILGQDLTQPEPDSEYALTGRFACGRGRCAIVDPWTDADSPQIQPLVFLWRS